jgi:hypothetical protein
MTEKNLEIDDDCIHNRAKKDRRDGYRSTNCFVEKLSFAAPSALRVVEKLNALTARYCAVGSTII